MTVIKEIEDSSRVKIAPGLEYFFVVPCNIRFHGKGEGVLLEVGETYLARIISYPFKGSNGDPAVSINIINEQKRAILGEVDIYVSGLPSKRSEYRPRIR